MTPRIERDGNVHQGDRARLRVGHHGDFDRGRLRAPEGCSQYRQGHDCDEGPGMTHVHSPSVDP